MSGKRTWLARAALVAWFAASCALGGILLLRHVLALPTPSRDDRTLHDALAAALPAPAWRAYHFMYRPCSRRTIDHLIADPRPADLHELVVMVDDDGAAGPTDAVLRARGFAVEVVTPAALHARFHLEAAPVLVVTTPAGEVAYVGGYNTHKQSLAYQDAAIVAELRARDQVSSLPVFGCATSARLANLVDPLGLQKL